MGIEGITRKQFLVMGRVGMDLTALPLGVAADQAETMLVSMGGSSANIAAGLVRMGCEAALLTCVSQDAVGQYCLNQLDRYGINRRYVRQIGGEPRSSLAIVDARLQDHQSVIYRNNAADFQMSSEDVDRVDYGQFGALVTTGTVFAADPSRSAAFKALELARAAGLTVIFDIDYRPYSWASAQVAEEILSQAATLSDVIIGNDEEFGFMAGDPALGLDRARGLVTEKAAIAVYKRGPLGSVTFVNGMEFHCGIFQVEALKPTGAGDAFMAGFLAALANGLSLRDAVRRGSAAAAIVVTKPGCAPAMPDPTELDMFLTTHPGPS